jgi:DNA-binding Lrp family transcriptional regulator
MDFTANEKEVLSLLLVNSRVTDVDIAKKLGVSPQAIGKIRKNLEEDGVIKNYSIKLDYEKLGVYCFAFIYMDILPKFLQQYTVEEIKNVLAKSNHVLLCSKVFSSDYQVIALDGFRSQKELENYIDYLRINLSDLLRVIKVETFSNDSLFKCDDSGIFKKILNNESLDVKFNGNKKL